jgi:RimJ/RimL family protein N-acetyltransferase
MKTTTRTPPVLETARLVLRPFAEQDIEAVLAACQDEEIQRWVPVPAPYTRADAEMFVRESCPAGWHDGTMLNLGSFTRDTGALVSSVGVSTGNRQPGIAEIGYWTAREQRGHGCTAEAVTALSRWAFEELGVQRLEWMTAVGNVGSRAVARKAGYVMEGTLRSRMVHRGERLDVWSGALLPSDLPR